MTIRLKSGLLLICLGLSGCQMLSNRLPPVPPNVIKPVIAVALFENEAGFKGQWQLGRGIPDLLVAELLTTGYVTVVDRQNLSAVVSEIRYQDQDLFRKENNVQTGRLKSARYLVRGTITDFTQTGNSSGWFSAKSFKTSVFGSRAVVMVNITLIDVETGEILKSISADGTVGAFGLGSKVNYRNISFGGEKFFRTPIGKATRKALNKAVVEIVRALPFQAWQPRIADVSSKTVIINGGANFNLEAGNVFTAYEKGRLVTDPETGDVIGQHPGTPTAQIQITSVLATSAEAVILSGQPKRGDYLTQTWHLKNE